MPPKLASIRAHSSWMVPRTVASLGTPISRSSSFSYVCPVFSLLWIMMSFGKQSHPMFLVPSCRRMVPGMLSSQPCPVCCSSWACSLCSWENSDSTSYQLFPPEVALSAFDTQSFCVLSPEVLVITQGVSLQ